MNKLRQVLRLHSQGKGTKAIATLLNMSRMAVKKYLSRLHECPLSVEEVLGLNDKDLSDPLQEKPEEVINKRKTQLEKLLPVYCKRLKRKGVTREMLYREYKEKYPDGYSGSRFCDYLMKHEVVNSAVMHLEHKAGDKLFIDFAGKKLHIIEPSTSEVISVEVFVAILPCK